MTNEEMQALLALVQQHMNQTTPPQAQTPAQAQAQAAANEQRAEQLMTPGARWSQADAAFMQGHIAKWLKENGF